MTDANAAMALLHDRVPMFLSENERDTWLKGSFDNLLAFRARRFPDRLIEVERSPELWVKKRKASAWLTRARSDCRTSGTFS
jgi:putative SOS response-associated peptidase YedK